MLSSIYRWWRKVKRERRIAKRLFAKHEATAALARRRQSAAWQRMEALEKLRDAEDRRDSRDIGRLRMVAADRTVEALRAELAR